MKLAIAAPALATVLVATLPAATDALRGSSRNLQGNSGRPSDVLTEEGDYHPSPEDDCIILAADHLMIPEGHEGHVRRLQDDDDSDLEFGCGFPDGSIAEMEVTPAQKAELADVMIKGEI
jgi:hypothetical protein